MDVMRPQAGFTLIELMVVLLIIGIASAAVGLNIKPDPQQRLRKDAEALAQALQVAQAEVQADGRAIRWLSDSKGYRFSRDDGQGGVEQFSDDPQLRPRPWRSTSMHVHTEPGKRLLLTPEWISAPLRLSLFDGQHSLSVLRSATGEVKVQ